MSWKYYQKRSEWSINYSMHTRYISQSEIAKNAVVLIIKKRPSIITSDGNEWAKPVKFLNLFRPKTLNKGSRKLIKNTVASFIDHLIICFILYLFHPDVPKSAPSLWISIICFEYAYTQLPKNLEFCVRAINFWNCIVWCFLLLALLSNKI